MIMLKQPDEVAKMRAAGRVVAEILDAVGKQIAPGMRTKDVDAIAVEVLQAHGATSPFYHKEHYRGGPPFPASTCVSVNEELVHGIPSARVLKEGDIVGVDAGAVLDGWIGDGAWTFGVGKISPVARRLLDVTRDALYRAIAAAKAGNRLGDLGWAVESHVKANGFSVIREYVGHGVGREMWEEPQVPNFGTPGRGIKLQDGMTMAIEPMVAVGQPRTREAKDRWTVVIADKSLSAQFEHTVVIRNGSAEILTQL
ncbi:MAG: type I methionyl aminopeptidase [Chloroflexi bacterium]|nr:type I methionyl aminopeptidase [Chloroflexota bacterium]